MSSQINWANVVTIGRVILAFITFAVLIYFPNQANYLYFCFISTILLISADYLDGRLARSLNQSSAFGAWLDIAGDRIIEICYWVVFTYLGWVSPWIAIIFVTRAILVDGVRSFAQMEGFTPFGEKTMMSSGLGKFLVSSRISRGTYNTLKASAFSGLILAQNHQNLQFLAHLFVYMATLLCIIRGLPVLVEGKRFLKVKQ